MTRVVIHNHLARDTEKPRAGYKGLQTHAYASSGVDIIAMGDNRWYVFSAAGTDLGVDFKTLREARVWAAQNQMAVNKVEQ